MTATSISGPSQVAHERLNGAEPYVIGSLSDGHKLGLAIESGGGAGPVTLGKLQAFEETGVLGVIDEIHAISIGAINACAQMAGQTGLALEGYDMMTQKDFVKISRIQRIFDMRKLDRVLRSSKGLDVEKIIKSPTPIHVGVSVLTGGLRPVSVDLSKQDPENVIDWLMRGAHLGIAAGPAPKDSKGNFYADGGFSHLSAVSMAVINGCTDVFMLSNQPFARDVYKAWQVALMGAGLSPYDLMAIPAFGRIVRAQIASRRGFKDGTFKYGDALVEGFYPPKSDSPENALPTLFNTDPKRIMVGFNIGKLSVLQRLAGLLPTVSAQPAN